MNLISRAPLHAEGEGEKGWRGGGGLTLMSNEVPRGRTAPLSLLLYESPGTVSNYRGETGSRAACATPGFCRHRGISTERGG